MGAAAAAGAHPVTGGLRLARLRAREVLQTFSTHDRFRFCGHPVGETVGVKWSPGVAGLRGLASCGSVWVCPSCSARISSERAADLERGIGAWLDPSSSARAERGTAGALMLTTLTIRHHAGQSLAAVWDSVSSAWRRATQSRSWRDAKARLGVVGYHRTTEVTHGASGWHVHLHVLLFLDARPGEATALDGGAALIAAWLKAVGGVGASALGDAQDARLLVGTSSAVAAVAQYVTKGTYSERAGQDRPLSSVALEVARSDLKSGRGGSRTPFQVLADLVAYVRETGTVSESDWALWQEWERTSKGRRQQTWSRGLRDLLGLDEERTDEEIAEDEVGGDEVVAIPAAAWRQFSAVPERVADLLGAVEVAPDAAAARAAATRVLRAHGVSPVDTA